MRPAILVSQPPDVRARLKQLCLDEAVLLQVAHRVLSARNSATENHPRNAAGLFGFLEGVAAMRELLAPSPYKWHREDVNNLSLTVNKENSVAIIVATGDEGTGREDMEPCTNSKKGPNTKTAVESNLNQWRLFPDDIKKEDFLKATHGRTTWLFLVHYDEINERLHCELSQPVAMTENDHVSGWSVRIILGPISPTMPGNRVSVDLEPSPEIDVKVKKRG